MQAGSIDLVILVIVFMILQILWIFPIVGFKMGKKKSRINLKDDIAKLERIFKNK